MEQIKNSNKLLKGEKRVTWRREPGDGMGRGLTVGRGGRLRGHPPRVQNLVRTRRGDKLNKKEKSNQGQVGGISGVHHMEEGEEYKGGEGNGGGKKRKKKEGRGKGRWGKEWGEKRRRGKKERGGKREIVR